MQKEKNFPPATLEKISEILLHSDQIPLLSAPTPFPFDALSQELSPLLDGKEVQFTKKPKVWKTKEELFHLMGENPQVAPVLFSPLEGEALWIMSQADMHKLTSNLLFKHGEAKGFLSDVLEEGYFRYLLLELLSLLSKMELFSPFSLKISDSAEPQDTSYLCQDLLMKIDGHAVSGRVAISSLLQKSWQQHFAATTSFVSGKIASSLELSLSCQAGSTQLLPSLFQKIGVGDFLLLDSMNYDPKKEKFSLLVALGDLPLFQAKLHKDSIELINPASYHEETTMEDKPSPNLETALADLPMNIVVEMGRIPITLEKLSQLEPGNFLTLPSFDNQVSLLVGGKKLAKGELVYIGDALGVRISEIS